MAPGADSYDYKEFCHLGLDDVCSSSKVKPTALSQDTSHPGQVTLRNGTFHAYVTVLVHLETNKQINKHVTERLRSSDC
jgi:hypothetical protein